MKNPGGIWRSGAAPTSLCRGDDSNSSRDCKHAGSQSGFQQRSCPMTPFDRRQFLKALSGTAVATTLMDSIAKATAVPAFSRTGTIDDVKHVVFLMQENRAFD